MSNALDVALRIRLERAGFREGRRDLEDLQRAAGKLGSERGAGNLARDIGQVERAANEATRDVEQVARAADRLGRNQGADRLKREFRETRGEIGRSETAIRDVGREADRLDRDRFVRFRRSVVDTDRQVDRLARSLRDAGRTRTGLEGAGSAAGLLASSGQAAFNAIAAFAGPAAIIAGLSQLEQKFRDVDRAAAGVAMTAEMLDPQTRQKIIASNKELGARLGAPQAGIAEARQVFAAGGYSDPDVQTRMLDPTLKAAIAAGVPPEMMAQAGRAYIGTMAGRPEDLGAAYDMMAKGGKLGSFELGAIAKNLPQLGSAYAATGGTGLNGLSELVALAQVAAKGAGSEDEAANNLSNYLTKIFSPETVANFGDKGVDLPRLIEEARAKGQHPALAVLDSAQGLTGGDPFKMGELFGDQQVMNALRPLMQNRELLTQYQSEIQSGSAGTVERDYQYFGQTASGREDAERARREVAQVTVGEAVSPGAAAASSAYTGLWEGAARVGAGFLEGIGEGAKRLFQETSPAWHLYQGANMAPGQDPEEIAERRRQAAALKSEIEADQAAIDGSGRSVNWMAESRLERKRNRYRGLIEQIPGGVEAEELEGLRSELGTAEGERAATVGRLPIEAESLERRIDQLRSAIEDLERRIAAGGVSPISYGNGGGGVGEPRVWNASLGGSQGSFTSAYDSGRPVMDGMANRPSGATVGPGRAASGSVRATRSPGGAAGELFDVWSTSFDDHQSLALLGHAKKESGLDPNAWNAEEGAGGILQWRGNRLENLKGFAAQQGMDWRDRKVQAAFVDHEMKTDPYERKRSARFRNAKTLEEASAGLEDYVRFGDGSGAERLGNAKGFAEQFGAAASGGGRMADAMGVAERFNGKHERRDNAELKGFIGENANSGALDPATLAWCAAFVNASLGAAGIEGSGSNMARSFLKWGEASTGAEGDVAVLKRGAAPFGHTGFVKGYTERDGERFVQILGGNQSDGVNVKEFPESQVLGYRRAVGDDPAVADAATAVTGKLPPRAARPARPTPRPERASEDAIGAGGRAETRPLTVTQHIYGSGDPKIAAQRSQRAQHRAMMMAEAGAMHDTPLPVG